MEAKQASATSASNKGGSSGKNAPKPTSQQSSLAKQSSSSAQGKTVASAPEVTAAWGDVFGKIEESIVSNAAINTLGPALAYPKETRKAGAQTQRPKVERTPQVQQKCQDASGRC